MVIIQAGEPVLRQRARSLTPEEIRGREIQDLISQMRETMRAAPGVGLAAPQIGLPLQLAVIEDRKEYHKDVAAEQLALRERRPVAFHVIANPVIEIGGSDPVEFYEGCLSLPGFFAVVSRAHSVRVQCLDHKGKPETIEASGWYARILQHEIDHLHGKLYVDRMNTRTFTSSSNFERYWKGKPIQQVRQELGA